MDELKLSLGPDFLRSLLAKVIRKQIRKKLGCDVDILIKEVHMTSSNGRVTLHIDADAETTTEDIIKMIKGADLD